MIDIDYADNFTITSISDKTEYFVINKFTRKILWRILYWGIKPNLNYIWNIEIISKPRKIRQISYSREGYFISDPFIVNSLSSISLLENFIFNNEDFLSSLRKHPETILLIHCKQIYEIK
jgi:hypothetical protein